jgi:hypothetical protein
VRSGIISAGAQLSWVGRISANLLRDEELVDLIADSAGKWIFIGMESLDPAASATANAIESMADAPVPHKISLLVARIFFRGIYFPLKGIWGWLKVVAQNRGSIFRIVKESFTKWSGAPGNNSPRLELDLDSEDSRTSVGSKPEAAELTVTQ